MAEQLNSWDDMREEINPPPPPQRQPSAAEAHALAKAELERQIAALNGMSVEELMAIAANSKGSLDVA